MTTLADFWQEVKKEKRSVILLTSSAVLLTVSWYQGYYTFFLDVLGGVDGGGGYALWHAHGLQFLANQFLMVLIPVLIIKLVLKESLRDFGVQLGDWRFGLKYLGAACVILLPVLYLNSADPAFQAEYPLVRGLYSDGPFNPFLWELTYLVYYIAWEFHFRGFQQLGMEKRVGPVVAITIQMIATTLIHVRKPFGETFSAITGAWLIGILTWRSRSVLWGILLHWYLGAVTDYFCYLRLAAGS